MATVLSLAIGSLLLSFREEKKINGEKIGERCVLGVVIVVIKSSESPSKSTTEPNLSLSLIPMALATG